MSACEARRMLSGTVLDDAGNVTGTLETYVPPGGVKAVDISDFKPEGGREVAGFQIEIAFAGGLTASQQAVFSNAAARWQSIITGDIPDIGASPGQWGAAVDDIRITAQGQIIDGVGGILGSAGPNFIRLPSNLPISGVMTFDSADLANMEANGTLNDVILHEMGHVLGLGTLWSTMGLITGAGTSNPIFTGTNAVTEYRRMAGNNALTSVPVENTGGAGTRDGHWRETTFNTELMTGFINGATRPLSRVTAAQFIDLGYPAVNVDIADLYTTTNPLPTVGTLTPSVPSSSAGAALSLNLSAASDNGSVSSVSFYRETNGIAGLQTTGTSTVTADTTVGTDSAAAWSTAVNTTGLANGVYTYYARAADNFGLLSAVATTTHTISSVTTPPSTPDLTTDSGASATDNITNDNTPTFIGTATVGATISLLVDNVSVASALVDGLGNWSVTTPVIGDGAHAITATATLGSTSAPSGALSITIDTVGLTLQGEFKRSPTQAIHAFFNETIFGSVPGAFTLQNTSTSQTFGSTFTGLVPGGLVGGFGYGVAPANGLTDGSYTATIGTAGYADVAGNGVINPTFSFRFLRADFNGDFTVNFDDLLIVAQFYGAGSGATNAQGDANYDGAIDFGDLLIVAQTYGVSLPALNSAAPAKTFGSTVIRRESAVSRRVASDVL